MNQPPSQLPDDRPQYSDHNDGIQNTWNGLPTIAKVVIGIVAGLFAVFVIGKILPGLVAAMGIGMMIIILFVPYWIPTIVAFIRNHPSKGAILVLNLFLGWTFIGWVVALVWSFGDNTPRAAQNVIVVNNMATTGYPTPAQFPVQGQVPPQVVYQAMPTELSQPQQPMIAQPTYQVGDVVNGYRFNGESWVAIRS